MNQKKTARALYCFMMVSLVILFTPPISIGGNGNTVWYKVTYSYGAYHDREVYSPVKLGEDISSCHMIYVSSCVGHLRLKREGCNNQDELDLAGYIEGWNTYHVPDDPPEGALFDVFRGEIETLEGPLSIGNCHCGAKTPLAWAVPCSTSQAYTRFVVRHDTLPATTLIKNHSSSGSPLATASVIDTSHTALLPPGKAIRYFADGSFDYPCLAVFSGVDTFGTPGTTARISYEIVNTTDEQKTYNITVTDTLGWTIRPLMLVVDVPPQGVVSIPVEIDLPSGSGGQLDGILLQASGYGYSDIASLIVSSSSVIPTLTEWGLIIFGVILAGVMTWVFLKRRKSATVGI